ncbi:phage baseplate upper protein [Enterococcus faecium]|uniref:BppU family phage baseplate upper protein n=1 Tax=Enterococcus faecium TaxID=1352 RepID=UPI0039B4D8FC|nr:phage baseplate upper protein [Enterococcus faecium]MCU2188202.1 phage baseplate upper protein [Enterococcus faecium]MCU2196541.1 phage baseplate upper protein [Enterococcus faecium]
MAFKINESIIVIQAEATSPNRTNVVFWSHDRGTAKLRMKLVRKNGVPQSLPEGTTVPIRLMFRSATAEGGYGKHDYLATVEDPVNGIVSIVLEDNILGYVGTVEGSVYIDFPNDRSLDTAGRFTFYIKRSPIDDSTPELENYYFNGFSQTIDKIEKILADGKQEIDQKITESETQIDAKLKDTNDKITKANQKITEYDQNLNEMRNGMKLYEAWAWSKDGTDRFTRKYPGENYAKNSRRALELSNVTNNINLLKGDVPYNFADLAGKTVTISVEIEVKNAQPQTSGVDFRIGCEASIPRASGGTFYLGVWEKLSAGQTIATKRISRTLSIPNDIVATQASGLHLYVQANGDYFRVSKPKIEIGDTPTIYTPAPSEDYENAYPQYRGLALLPSDLPDDYSWDVTPEYVEKGLNNTVSLTEPETVLGLKNFKDGAQIDGVDVATVKNLGSVLQSGSGLTTIQSDKQSAFDEFSYEFERIGDRVFFHARVKTNSTTAVASHVNLLEIPLGFQFPVEWTIVGIPLSVVQWTTPQGEISALVITDLTGKQVVKFATNRVGNHYISGEWRTADSYPETK